MVGSRLDYCNSILYKITKANVTICNVYRTVLLVWCCKCQDAHMSTICLHSHTGCQSATVSSTRLLSSRTKALKFGQPRYLADLLIHQHQVRATRAEGQCRLHQPVPNSRTSSRGFRYAALSIWNLKLPDLRIKETVLTFKTGLKPYMFLSAYGR